jgi:demethylmenaquinone methyltransferase / 2-methoxy-6-polyprenyl-1,4-benzoquinol methylase
MLEMGRKKMAAKNLSHKIELVKGDSEKLIFTDNTFDAVIVAFGVRNFETLEKGLADIYRVLKPNGKLVVLEFSNPKKFPIKQFYKFYSSKILPKIGNSISKDKSAYTYLPESVEAFPDGTNFTNVMQKVSFNATTVTSLSGGIASIYTGKK